MIELTNISKSYESTRVLAPINLVIERGRTTVLIGPSGCGKSTLLRIMVGLETADTGGVCFDGVELTPANAAEMRRQMGYVLKAFRACCSLSRTSKSWPSFVAWKMSLISGPT